MCIYCYKVVEQGFGVIEQVSLYVVFVEFQQGYGFYCVGEFGVGDQMLMQLDCLIDFVVLMEQIVQCQMGFDCIVVVFGQFEEDFDCFVLFFVEQVVQIVEIIGGKFVYFGVRMVYVSFLCGLLIVEEGYWQK